MCPDVDRFDLLSPIARDRLVPAVSPSWVQADACHTYGGALLGPCLIFERKLDGERCLAFRASGAADRRSPTATHSTSTISSSQTRCPVKLRPDLVDGEVVAFSGDETSFSRLQHRMQTAYPRRAGGVRRGIGRPPRGMPQSVIV